jgi:hypothetical protein
VESGGTYPKQIIDAIRSKNIPSGDMNLVLITDGEVGTSEIDQCDSAIKQNGISFAFATVYIIGRNIETNLSGFVFNIFFIIFFLHVLFVCLSFSFLFSVCAPFTRYCGSRVITLNSDTLHADVAPAVQVSKADLDLLNSIGKINTFEQLMEIHEGLQRALTARVLGTDGDQFCRFSL